MILIGSGDDFRGLLGVLSAGVSKIAVWFIPRKLLLRMLWPDRCDTVKKPKNRKLKAIKVRFPKAPEYFLRSLQAVVERGLHPNVAAVPEAIIVSRREVVSAWVQSTEERVRELRNEPVLYLHDENKENVAIMSSYGEFPNEKKVVEWVKREGLQVAFN